MHTILTVTTLALSLLAAQSALAYQHLVTFRIAGKDIQSVTAGKHVEEDPASLTLKLAPAPGQAAEIVLESDGDLDDCQQQLGYIIGSKTDYVEIVIDMNAQTMNGILVIQCATFFGLFGDGT